MSRKIKLSAGFVALVDDDDFEYLNQFNWAARKGRYTYYAVRWVMKGGKRAIILMHRLIVRCPRSKEVDHKDRNGLNNTRENLRICTHGQNMSNALPRSHSSQFRGVSWSKKNKDWVAQITSRGKNRSIGHFDNEVDAAIAYNQAALKYHGEFANLNRVK